VGNIMEGGRTILQMRADDVHMKMNFGGNNNIPSAEKMFSTPCEMTQGYSSLCLIQFSRIK